MHDIFMLLSFTIKCVGTFAIGTIIMYLINSTSYRFYLFIYFLSKSYPTLREFLYDIEMRFLSTFSFCVKKFINSPNTNC